MNYMRSYTLLHHPAHSMRATQHGMKGFAVDSLSAARPHQAACAAPTQLVCVCHALGPLSSRVPGHRRWESGPAGLAHAQRRRHYAHSCSSRISASVISFTVQSVRGSDTHISAYPLSRTSSDSIAAACSTLPDVCTGSPRPYTTQTCRLMVPLYPRPGVETRPACDWQYECKGRCSACQTKPLQPATEACIPADPSRKEAHHSCGTRHADAHLAVVGGLQACLDHGVQEVLTLLYLH